MTDTFAWARRNLFARPVDVVLTVIVAALVLGTAYAILDWAVFSATWSGNSRERRMCGVLPMVARILSAFMVNLSGAWCGH